MNKIALTIDIEDWYHTPAVTGSPFAFYPSIDTFMSKWNSDYDYITAPTSRLLSILEDFGLKATFFIVANVIDYYPGLVERIVKGGHEIGCHSYHHEINIHPTSKKQLFTKDEFEDQTGLAKEKIEKVYGQKLLGYRAPGAYIGSWMFDSLMNVGFKYDSSVSPNSFFNKTDFQIKNIKSKPYLIKHSSLDNTLIEIPWPYFTLMGIKFPTGGGPFLRFMPINYLALGLKNSLQRGSTVFYLHSIDISYSKIPRIASKNKRRPLYFITSGKNTEKKLIHILKLFHSNWCTCSELLNEIELNGSR